MKTVDGRRPIVKNKKYAPATGIQSDFEKILTSFVETKSVRFEEFSKIWRERKVSLICAGRHSEREAVEFMEECMKAAFKMFLPPYGFQARVGALYLLYGLYYTQPCVPKVKIRVTQAWWEQVKEMQKEFESQNHHDSNFILHKLMADGAFYFCAAAEQPRSRYQQAEDSNKALADALREDRQSIDDLFSDETLEQLGLIHSHYHHLKVRCAGPDASRPDRSLDVLQDKFPTSIHELIEKHHERWKKREATRHGRRPKAQSTMQEDRETEEVGMDPDSEPSGSVGQRRAHLREMAFTGAKSKHRDRYRILVTEANAPSPSTSPSKKKGKHKGDKAESSIQRVTSADSLLHMPQLGEDTEHKGSRPGRKHKAQTSEADNDTPSTEQDMHDSNRGQTSEDSPQSASASAVAAAATVATSSLSSHRKRGRPSKHGKVGRPPKQLRLEEEAGCSNKGARAKVVPLKVKELSSGKNK